MSDTFSLDLPTEQIARRPLEDRAAGRLLVVGEPNPHRCVRDVPQLLRDGDVLVVNDTTVIPARLFGEKAGTGGKVEVLLVRPADKAWVCLVNASKRAKPGTRLVFEEGFFATVEEAMADEPGAFRVRFEGDARAFAEEHGHVPLPPYLEREDDEEDVERYQTVFHDDRKPGSCAAPTAGLHFDHALLEHIRARGVEVATVTLHVGPGTFLPMRGSLEEHVMHPEPWIIDEANACKINAARRVIAVGTTSLRCLESAAGDDAVVRAGGGLTRLFIKPGYGFKVVDALLTNFHLADSTLFVLVCAFAGTERMRAAYRDAVREGYRFYSYGDACFLQR
jgi:S-adenosylmethionine:tRNA ribosyltransferase-isomerase